MYQQVNLVDRSAYIVYTTADLWVFGFGNIEKLFDKVSLRAVVNS